MIRVLQTHALPLGYVALKPIHFILKQALSQGLKARKYTATLIKFTAPEDWVIRVTERVTVKVTESC